MHIWCHHSFTIPPSCFMLLSPSPTVTYLPVLIYSCGQCFVVILTGHTLARTSIIISVTQRASVVAVAVVRWQTWCALLLLVLLLIMMVMVLLLFHKLFFQVSLEQQELIINFREWRTSLRVSIPAPESNHKSENWLTIMLDRTHKTSLFHHCKNRSDRRACEKDMWQTCDRRVTDTAWQQQQILQQCNSHNILCDEIVEWWDWWYFWPCSLDNQFCYFPWFLTFLPHSTPAENLPHTTNTHIYIHTKLE